MEMELKLEVELCITKNVSHTKGKQSGAGAVPSSGLEFGLDDNRSMKKVALFWWKYSKDTRSSKIIVQYLTIHPFLNVLNYKWQYLAISVNIKKNTIGTYIKTKHKTQKSKNVGK